MLIFDGHLDLAMNALFWNRDLTVPVHEQRRLETGMSEKGRGRGTVAFPEMRQGGIGICLATVIARDATAADHLVYAWPFPLGPEEIEVACGEDEIVVMCPSWLVGERTVELRAGQGCLVPQGIWHRLILGRPSDLLFVTPAHGTRHQPVGAAAVDG